jgi:hypothetical protein
MVALRASSIGILLTGFGRLFNKKAGFTHLLESQFYSAANLERILLGLIAAQ